MPKYNNYEVIAQTGLIIMLSNGKTVNIQGEFHNYRDDGKPIENVSIYRDNSSNQAPSAHKGKSSGGYQGKPENNRKHVDFRKRESVTPTVTNEPTAS